MGIFGSSLVKKMQLKRRFYVKAAWKGREVSISDPAFFSLFEKSWVRDRVYYEEPMVRGLNPRFRWLDYLYTPRTSFIWYQPVDSPHGTGHQFLPYNSTFIKYSLNCASAIRAGLTADGGGDYENQRNNPDGLTWQWHPELGGARMPVMRHWSNYTTGYTGEALRRIDSSLHNLPFRYFSEKTTLADGLGIKDDFTTKADTSYRDWDSYMQYAYMPDYLSGPQPPMHDYLSGPQQMIRLTDAWPFPIWDAWRYAGPQRRPITYSGENEGFGNGNTSEKNRENTTTRKTQISYTPPYYNGQAGVTVRAEKVPLNYGYFIGDYVNQDIVVRFAWIRGVPLGSMGTEDSYWAIGESWQQEFNLLPWWKKVTHSNGTSFRGRHIRVRFYKTAGEHVYRQTVPSDDYLIDTHYYPLDYEFHKGSPVAVYDVGENDYISAFVDFDWPIPEGIDESAFNNYPHGVGHLSGIGPIRPPLIGADKAIANSADLARRAAHLVSGACYWGGFEVFASAKGGTGQGSEGAQKTVTIGGGGHKWTQVQQPYIKSGSDWQKADSVYKKVNGFWTLVHSGKKIPTTVRFPSIPLKSEDPYREDGNFHYIDVDLMEYMVSPESYGAPKSFETYPESVLNSTPLEITVHVDPGVKILRINITKFHASTRVILRNYGMICGRGGGGGARIAPHNVGSELGLQHFSELDGLNGEPAIATDHDISIRNYGEMYGGGGGGHAGMPYFIMDLSGQLLYDRGQFFLSGGSQNFHGASLSLPGYWKPAGGFQLSNSKGIFHESFTRGWYSDGRPTVHGSSYTIPAQGYWYTTLVAAHRYRGYYGWPLRSYRYIYTDWISQTVWRETSPAKTVRPETPAVEAGNFDIPVLEQAVFWNVLHGGGGGGGAPYGPKPLLKIQNDNSPRGIWDLKGLGIKWGQILSRIIWDHNFNAYDKDHISQFDFTSFAAITAADEDYHQFTHQNAEISTPLNEFTLDAVPADSPSERPGSVEGYFGQGIGHLGGGATRPQPKISNAGFLTGVLKNRAIWNPGTSYSLSNPDHLRHGGRHYMEVAGMTRKLMNANGVRSIRDVLDVKGVTKTEGNKVTGIDPWVVEISTPDLFGGSAYSNLGDRTPLFRAKDELGDGSSSGGLGDGGSGGSVSFRNLVAENDLYRRWPNGLWKQYLGKHIVYNYEDFPACREVAKDSWNKGVKAWLDSWKTDGGKGGELGEAGESFTIAEASITRFGQKIILPSITINGGSPGKIVQTNMEAVAGIPIKGTMKGQDV